MNPEPAKAFPDAMPTVARTSPIDGLPQGSDVLTLYSIRQYVWSKSSWEGRTFDVPGQTPCWDCGYSENEPPMPLAIDIAGCLLWSTWDAEHHRTVAVFKHRFPREHLQVGAS